MTDQTRHKKTCEILRPLLETQSEFLQTLLKFYKYYSTNTVLFVCGSPIILMVNEFSPNQIQSESIRLIVGIIIFIHCGIAIYTDWLSNKTRSLYCAFAVLMGVSNMYNLAIIANYISSRLYEAN